MSNLIFDLNRGYLSWNGRSYRAVSGPFKVGALEPGRYRVEINNVVTNIDNNIGLQDPITKQGWFIPITPLFNSDRTGLGIHPDGGNPGTEGCIGIQGYASGMFWKAWLETSMQNRPGYLIVVEDARAEMIS